MTLFFTIYGYHPKIEIYIKDNITEGEAPAATSRIKKL